MCYSHENGDTSKCDKSTVVGHWIGSYGLAASYSAASIGMTLRVRQNYEVTDNAYGHDEWGPLVAANAVLQCPNGQEWSNVTSIPE
ncbi:hypothetical protein T265_05201 [Opisthorchis viverrini]|uniref:Uncharacterized protein n=1 Tax=Opisthorchis viverrini TaxID=6198 RepID=A0A074ZWX2_OPIVI|nr:hypothetical protein T265_05201 [Opisthorchis viverrini]KER27845.1 hypothetical protein T265_05201 [Opisthorchis viverrini]